MQLNDTLRKPLPWVSSVPEHLKSWSCSWLSACPLSWLGEKQRACWARRGAFRSHRESQARWQSQCSRLSASRSVRNRLNSPSAELTDVRLLPFSVLTQTKARSPLKHRLLILCNYDMTSSHPIEMYGFAVHNILYINILLKNWNYMELLICLISSL